MTRTTLLTTTDIGRIVATHGLPTVLARMVKYLEADYHRWQAFEKTPRLASHSPVGVIELMPICDDREYSFKYVNGHPGNPAKGLSTVVAFGVLADVVTGYPSIVSELTLCTALRTAGTSVMAAKLLARADSKVMALIGNGAQSDFQANAFHHLLGIEQVRLFDVDPAATEKLIANLALSAPKLKVVRCANAAEAVKGADIVTTITADKTSATIITADMIAPGMHLNAVGGDCPGKTELAADVLNRASVFVEFEPQSRIEGELQQMPADFKVCELWRVFAGEATGRRDATEVTLFDSVGFALEDYAALRMMRDYAHEMKLGHDAGLIPDMADPKNLFGYMIDQAAKPESKVA